MPNSTVVALLGSLPLDIRIREQADSGNPTVAAEPDSNIARALSRDCPRVAVKIAESSKTTAVAFPKIVIQNNLKADSNTAIYPSPSSPLTLQFYCCHERQVRQVDPAHGA
jgi:hypothetical protein